MRDFTDSLERAGLRSHNAALYFPPLAAPVPSGRPLPPSGAVAGMYGRRDAQVGVWKAPAGVDAVLVDAQPQVVVGDQEVAELGERGVNLLRWDPAYGTFAWGAQTLGGSQEWKYVAICRTALFLESSLSQGLSWALFEPNDEHLWSTLRTVAGEFLLGLWRKGAFQGSSSDAAYLVRCGPDTMTQDDIDSGRVVLHVGFAALRPAELVTITIGLCPPSAGGPPPE